MVLGKRHIMRLRITRGGGGEITGGGGITSPCYVYIINNDISDCSNGQLSGVPSKYGAPGNCLPCLPHCYTSADRGPAHNHLIDRSVSAQTALVTRPSGVSPPEQV